VRAPDPHPPSTEAELDERLAEPTPGTAQAAEELGGDLIILGAGGKMGPSLAALARRSIHAAGVSYRVICASRFSDPELRKNLEAAGIGTVACDLLDPAQVRELPDAPNVVFMVGRKFGTGPDAAATWAANCVAPALAAERYRRSRTVALSTGNLYPLVPVESRGANEETPVGPVGEYAQSCLGRERVLEYCSRRHDTPMTLIRLNYATDLRYGVLLDIAQKVRHGEPVDLAMGFFNTIWQGDANAAILRALSLCESPPAVLNVTGPEVLSAMDVATRLAALMAAPEPVFTGVESGQALLSDASRCHELFGRPRVSAETLVEWTANWILSGGRALGTPTHFEVCDGAF